MQDHSRITAPSSDQSWGSWFFRYLSLSTPIIEVSQFHQTPSTVQSTTECHRKLNHSHNYRFLSFHWIEYKRRCKFTYKEELYSWKWERGRMEVIPKSSCVFPWTRKYFPLHPIASKFFVFQLCFSWTDHVCWLAVLLQKYCQLSMYTYSPCRGHYLGECSTFKINHRHR